MKMATQRFQEWRLHKLSRDEQKQLLAQHISMEAVKYSLIEDQAQDIFVIEDLVELVQEAITEAVLPEDYPEVPGISRDKVEADFKGFIANLNIRSMEMIKLSYPTLSSELEQYVRVISSKQIKLAYLRDWAVSINLFEYFKANGVPFLPTPEGLEQMHNFAALVDCLNRQQMQEATEPRVQLATAGSMAF